MADGIRTDCTNSFSCLMDKCKGKIVNCEGEKCKDFELGNIKPIGSSFG